VLDDPAAGSAQPVTAEPRDPTAPTAADPVPRSAPGEDRSPNISVCPFLRAIDEAGALGRPIESPDPANRCAALLDAVPQSLRQQELVCLTSGHVNCPRYLRGSVGAPESPERVHSTRTMTRSIALALALFALAFLVSLTFVLANGGLVLTAATASPSPAGGVLGDVETPAPTVTAGPTPTPTVPPTASPSATLTPSPAPTPTPTSTPTATPTPTPTATPTSPSGASPSRLALLTPCPDAPNCYVYVIRSGDNLSSIANYFGVSLAKVRAMNPWTSAGLTIGRGLRIPPPTR
jgi:LysM repeat protein